ncbi:flagellar hook protein FlgE [Myxococcota bacterium]|nr:flagellar hook protein FlgE [Myxococcota bacterium]MBU1429668.1 flagellar hook protein FlgE [Myxococcota bacterium]MBU1898129.1 flagellar hook protein FlgE [Myxococcota bacterium]
MAGLLSSLYNGNSGLRASAVGVGVVGDNIANSNTTGFKGGRAHFGDVMSELLVGASGPNQVGRGVTLQRIEKLFTQGSLQQTGVPTDMAIQGDGFFVLRGANGGEHQFTRAGAFRFNDEGFLVAPDGMRVQGYSADATGAVGAALGDIQLNQGNLAPNATTEVGLEINLSPRAPQNGPFDINDPDNTSAFQTTVQVYDSLGNAHEATVYGTRTADDTWEFNVVTGDPPAAQLLGDLVFDGAGRLDQENINPLAINWNNGSNPSQITFDFGAPGNGAGTGTGTNMWSEVVASELINLSQDGYGTGSLEHIVVGNDGVITGTYSNGESLSLGQVALARFNDPTGLHTVGGNNFIQTPDSGESIIGVPQSSGQGSIMAAALEMSNVELSDEFIDLIAYQRAFQANSKTIQTADGLIQEVFQLLR